MEALEDVFNGCKKRRPKPVFSSAKNNSPMDLAGKIR